MKRIVNLMGLVAIAWLVVAWHSDAAALCASDTGPGAPASPWYMEIRFRVSPTSGTDNAVWNNGDVVHIGYNATYDRVAACVIRSGGARNIYYGYDGATGTGVSQLTVSSFILLGSSDADVDIVNAGEIHLCFPPYPSYPRVTGFPYNGIQLDVYGEAGADRIQGGSGADMLCGGSGRDFLSGFEGIDELDGWTGGDVLTGQAGCDWSYGWTGGDILIEDPFPCTTDNYWGEAGNDCLQDTTGHGTMSCGPGTDGFIRHASYPASSDCEIVPPGPLGCLSWTLSD